MVIQGKRMLSRAVFSYKASKVGNAFFFSWGEIKGARNDPWKNIWSLGHLIFIPMDSLQKWHHGHLGAKACYPGQILVTELQVWATRLFFRGVKYKGSEVTPRKIFDVWGIYFSFLWIPYKKWPHGQPWAKACCPGRFLVKSFKYGQRGFFFFMGWNIIGGQKWPLENIWGLGIKSSFQWTPYKKVTPWSSRGKGLVSG